MTEPVEEEAVWIIKVEDAADVKPRTFLKWRKRSGCDATYRLDRALVTLGARERSVVTFFHDVILHNSSLFRSPLCCNKQSIPVSSSPTPRPP